MVPDITGQGEGERRMEASLTPATRKLFVVILGLLTAQQQAYQRLQQLWVRFGG